MLIEIGGSVEYFSESLHISYNISASLLSLLAANNVLLLTVLHTSEMFFGDDKNGLLVDMCVFEIVLLFSKADD